MLAKKAQTFRRDHVGAAAAYSRVSRISRMALGAAWPQLGAYRDARRWAWKRCWSYSQGPRSCCVICAVLHQGDRPIRGGRDRSRRRARSRRQAVDHQKNPAGGRHDYFRQVRFAIRRQRYALGLSTGDAGRAGRHRRAERGQIVVRLLCLMRSAVRAGAHRRSRIRGLDLEQVRQRIMSRRIRICSTARSMTISLAQPLISVQEVEAAARRR
jgi:hypothetical protein